MYQAFYGLTEKPFSLLPDPDFLYPSRQHQMALALLEYGIEGQAGFTVITGDIGTGKTTLIRQLLDRVSADLTVGLITNSHQTFGELLHWILEAYGQEVQQPNSKVGMYRQFTDFVITEYAKQRRTVLIIDEAQNLSVDTLEELRMLSNINSEKDLVLQVVLVGQHQLRDILKRPDMVQFAQRIATDYHLGALDEKETEGFIRHRIEKAGGSTTLFDDEACRRVFTHTGGVPRLINLLCDTALIYGYAENMETINANLIDEVAEEKQRGGLFPSPGQASVPATELQKAPTSPPTAASEPSAVVAKDVESMQPRPAIVVPQAMPDKSAVAPATPLSSLDTADADKNPVKKNFA